MRVQQEGSDMQQCLPTENPKSNWDRALPPISPSSLDKSTRVEFWTPGHALWYCNMTLPPSNSGGLTGSPGRFPTTLAPLHILKCSTYTIPPHTCLPRAAGCTVPAAEHKTVAAHVHLQGGALVRLPTSGALLLLTRPDDMLWGMCCSCAVPLS